WGVPACRGERGGRWSPASRNFICVCLGGADSRSGRTGQSQNTIYHDKPAAGRASRGSWRIYGVGRKGVPGVGGGEWVPCRPPARPGRREEKDPAPGSGLSWPDPGAGAEGGGRSLAADQGDVLRGGAVEVDAAVEDLAAVEGGDVDQPAAGGRGHVEAAGAVGDDGLGRPPAAGAAGGPALTQVGRGRGGGVLPLRTTWPWTRAAGPTTMRSRRTGGGGGTGAGGRPTAPGGSGCRNEFGVAFDGLGP